MSARLLPRSRAPRSVAWHLILPLVLAGIGGCGGGGDGGGGGGGSSQVVGTGSVAILLTDGPSDEFSEILLKVREVRLLCDAGQITIFEGHRTIDLLALKDSARLFALGREVPAGLCSKVRLILDDIELVKEYDDGSTESFHPRLPGNGKLDLNPREPFRVSPHRLLQIQADVDAEKSIHIVQTGQGGYNFRPVVFVDILSIQRPGRLVRLHGVIEDLDLLDESFLLCDTHPVSRPAVGGAQEGVRRTAISRSDDDNGDDRPMPPDDFCVEVLTDADTSIFDIDGNPAELEDLMNGDEASVLGRFMHVDHEGLVFRAIVVQQGPEGTLLRLDGIVATEVGDPLADTFVMEVLPGQGFVAGTALIVKLQVGTRIVSRRGVELDDSDILVEDPVRVFGVLDLDPGGADVLKSTIVVVDKDVQADRLSGTVASIDRGEQTLELLTDAGTVCIFVADGTDVFLVIEAGDGSESRRIDRGDLRVGDRIDVYGDGDGPCVAADTIIAFEDRDSLGQDSSEPYVPQELRRLNEAIYGAGASALR